MSLPKWQFDRQSQKHFGPNLRRKFIKFNSQNELKYYFHWFSVPPINSIEIRVDLRRLHFLPNKYMCPNVLFSAGKSAIFDGYLTCTHFGHWIVQLADWIWANWFGAVDAQKQGKQWRVDGPMGHWFRCSNFGAEFLVELWGKWEFIINHFSCQNNRKID